MNQDGPVYIRPVTFDHQVPLPGEVIMDFRPRPVEDVPVEPEDEVVGDPKGWSVPASASSSPPEPGEKGGHLRPLSFPAVPPEKTASAEKVSTQVKASGLSTLTS